MQRYLKLRTFIVVAVVAVFAFAIYPLTPPDFYKTFSKTVKPGKEAQAAGLIAAAMEKQRNRADLYPAAALLEAAETSNTELSAIANLPKAADNSEVVSMLRKRASSSIRLGLDLNGGVEFVLRLNPDYDALAGGGVSRAEAEHRLKTNFAQYRDLAMEALRRRLETQNIFETEIAPFSSYGLSLKAPLVSKDEKDKLQRLIQMSNKLEFRLVHPQSEAIINSSDAIPPGYIAMREETRGKGAALAPSYVVARHPEMTGNGIDRAFVSRNQYGKLMIALHFNTAGTKQFAEVTARNLNRQLAIVLDDKLYCAPVIKSEIGGGQAEITGKFSVEEAQNIADALTSGSFPFKIDVEAVYDTDPTLGADNVRIGIMTGVAAVVLLALFMIVYYRVAGLIAVIALSVNVVLILGAIAALDATMTMPGIAGIILTLGMAVDANVLVFERMREESEAGKGPRDIVDLGFQRAYSAVIDGNLTTLVVALILMYFGTGAIKGFAVSLSIGIVASLFTALFMSHVLFDWLLHWKPNFRFRMMRFFSKPHIPFMRQARIAIPASIAMIIISVTAIMWNGRDMLSVDFTGGTLLSYNYSNSVPVADLERTLAANGLAGKITYKSDASGLNGKKLELLLREGAENRIAAGADGMPAYVKGMFDKAHPELRLGDGQSTVIGGMVGSEMTRNAIISMLLAFAGMIVYVAFRYEFNYAVAGILALMHDVVIALGIFVLMGREMSLPVVAGLLTIVGYSINDTIVIFDRIREELKLHPERRFAEVVDDSLNRTLSRTILTSLTTFLVVMVMFICGGIAINDFMLVIGIGIIIGTYSSIYIASPLIVFYHNYKQRKASGKKAVTAAQRASLR